MIAGDAAAGDAAAGDAAAGNTPAGHATATVPGLMPIRRVEHTFACPRVTRIAAGRPGS